jgi:lysophospholipase L1-like esterase
MPTPEQIGAASKEELAVERKRIDQFAALKDGSTTGDAELMDIRIGYHGVPYATAGEAVRAQIGDVANAVFEDVEAKASSNVFNPNTAEAHIIGSTSGFISEVIPCAVGDVIYGRFENDDGSLGTLQTFGIYLIATNGTSVLTSTNLFGKYTVPTHASIPELLGVKVWVRESEVLYDNRSSVMVTINTEPTEFEKWAEVTTTLVNRIEKNRDELQEQIDDLQEQVENLQSEGTGNAVQYTVQNLTEAQKAQARANIGAVALPVVTDEDALRSSEGLTLSGNGVIPLGTWTTTSTDTPYMNASGEKFCTKKIKTSVLPQIRGALAPWNYTFWKNGVNLGVQLTYADAKAANFETNLAFDEVAVNYGYGYVDGISVTLFIPNADAHPFNKVLVMGDSISTDYYGNYTKWVTVLMNEGFFPKDTTNDSIHATGFVAKYTADNPNADNDFLTRIEAVTNKDTYDLVVIFGGINDFIQSVPLGESGGDKTVYFKPAVDYFFQYLVNNFTQARIVVLSPLRTYNPYPNQASVKQEEYAAYIRDVAKSYCLPVLNLTEESGFCPFNETFKNMWTYTGYAGGDGTKGDGVHPSAEYEERFLAPMIRNFLSQFI